MNRLHRWMIEKFLPRYAHELLLDELAECVAGSESPETELLRKELTASLNRFLRKLPEKDRTVFHCRAERREPGTAVCPAADRARVPHGTGGRAAA